MRAHTDEEILEKADAQEKRQDMIKDSKIDVAVDLDDEHGTCHTYVVTFQQESGGWKCLQIDELSSL
ncbi:hypothetical protein [Desertivirga arenae]|uniref:hypothetical protein n=1 Tax=Desertivirga arenae TaxID=2810309 RepID=UPI001A977C0B|nr:hypothetical protein [Pedobacter sp. SYSU D00823]